MIIKAYKVSSANYLDNFTKIIPIFDKKIKKSWIFTIPKVECSLPHWEIWKSCIIFFYNI